MKSFGKEISGNRESFNQIRDQSTKINNLLRRTTRQSNEVRELKKDLIKVQVINDKLTEDNEKMKEAISQIEQKLGVMEKPQQLPNRPRQITRPTTMNRTTLNQLLLQKTVN
uniref:uncharacterized protein LOC120346632 isoform X3 n=1 Tax=Styela clava TaxID=7725 RepID=UPI00193A78D3|nr:uncharacterized protein LOC120346632 isoform X3 [Styela clava]